MIFPRDLAWLCEKKSKAEATGTFCAGAFKKTFLFGFLLSQMSLGEEGL